jgi:hypothetical protein
VRDVDECAAYFSPLSARASAAALPVSGVRGTVNREQPIDDHWRVPEVIDSLLRVALPSELHALVPRLARECAPRE